MASRVRFMIGFLAAGMLACLCTACTMAPQPAPDFTVRDMKNQVFSLTDYKGKNIVLVFYIGDSCLPCFQQLGELQNHLAEIRALDAEVIAIASHGQQDVANTQSALNIEFVLVPGPQVALMKQFGVYNQQKQRANPATFIIDKAGLIRWKYVGGNDHDRPARSTILTRLRDTATTFAQPPSQISPAAVPQAVAAKPPEQPVNPSAGSQYGQSLPSPPMQPVPPLVRLQAERRLALVIGNGEYQQAGRLLNPVNDAQDLATLLRRLGFEVLLHQNADKPTMEKAVDLFTRGVPRGSAGLFFFSGHGVHVAAEKAPI